MSDDPKCVAGCVSFYGGEKRHHKDCPYYPESLTKANADRIEELEAKLAKAVGERDALTEALVEAMIVPEAWMMSGFPEMSNEAREQIIVSVTKTRNTLVKLTGGKNE